MSCKDNKHRHNKQEEIGYFSRRDATGVTSLNSRGISKHITSKRRVSKLFLRAPITLAFRHPLTV